MGNFLTCGDGPHFRGEAFIAAAFGNMGKYSDPLKLAAQDAFQQDKFSNLKTAICASLAVLAYRFSKNEDIVKRLDELYQKCLDVEDMPQLYGVIESGIEIVKEIDA